MLEFNQAEDVVRAQKDLEDQADNQQGFELLQDPVHPEANALSESMSRTNRVRDMVAEQINEQTASGRGE